MSNRVNTQTRARIHGIQKRPELNGQVCEVLYHDPASGRRVVQLPDGTELKLKPDNLETLPECFSGGQVAASRPAANSGDNSFCSKCGAGFDSPLARRRHEKSCEGTGNFPTTRQPEPQPEPAVCVPCEKPKSQARRGQAGAGASRARSECRSNQTSAAGKQGLPKGYSYVDMLGTLRGKGISGLAVDCEQYFRPHLVRTENDYSWLNDKTLLFCDGCGGDCTDHEKVEPIHTAPDGSGKVLQGCSVCGPPCSQYTRHENQLDPNCALCRCSPQCHGADIDDQEDLQAFM